MAIISILNPKGGSGKTTISTNLARLYHDRGFKTMLVDTDPQGSASDWHAVREDNPLPFVSYGNPDNLKALPGVAKAYDHVIIDGAAKLEGMIAAAIKISDAILIPVQPSPYDIWATSDLVDLIKARQEVTDGHPKAAFVISRAIERTLLGKEVGDALSEYKIPVLEAKTIQRQIYPRSASEGLSVFDGFMALKARIEINAIADELDKLITQEPIKNVA
ncbi:MAG: AAA family ATPase [Alphaproteobacteria bacterium]|nr:AAA family ATPase [Alphaproteobacteria bacterium]